MKLVRVVLACLATAVLLWGQAQVSSGDLKGTVVDPAGAAVVKARVIVSDPSHGLTRTAETDGAGEYRVPLLPPGRYGVRVEANGFTTKRMEGVELRVGDTVVLRTALEVGAVSSQVTVTAEAAVIEAERTQQSTTIDMRRIDNLPINRRNYLDFALLAPGVSETNDLVDGQDYRVTQTPQSGLSFGAGNGRSNAFTVDGVESYASSGSVRPTVNQEAVREFQINRNTFTAEFGGALGGAINIITKSGSNEVHGSLFGFLRNRAIQARNYFDPGKSAYTRGQYGTSFSAPLQRDKTFLFASFERLDRHETAFVPILQDRSIFGKVTPWQAEVIDYMRHGPFGQFGPLADQLETALLTNNYPDTLKLFNDNSGEFPFGGAQNQLTVRIDRQLGPNDTLFWRGSFTNENDSNSQLGALIGYSRGRAVKGHDASMALSNTRILSTRWVAETRALFDFNRMDVVPNDPDGPDITIMGYGSFGREIFLPSTTFERHYQLQQNFDFSSGRHAVKFGADINPVRVTARSETFFGGRFLFGQQIPLSAILDAASSPGSAAAMQGAFILFGRMDLARKLDNSVTALQAFNLGIPILYQQGFGNPNWSAWFRNFNFFAQDSWKPRPNLTLSFGARYELEGEPGGLNTDTNNLAPRIGLAWTPFANGRTVVRGGYGLYYGQINAQIANLPATLDGKQIAQVGITPLGVPGLINPMTGQPLTSMDVFTTLLAQGVIGRRPITAQDIAQFGLHPGPNAPGRVIFGITPDFVNPYAQQASFEVEHAFGDYTVSAGYEFNRGYRLPRDLDRNLMYTGKTDDGVPTFGFRDPDILQYNVLESTANSFYHALIVQAAKRFSGHFAVNAHYTFSKAIDQVTDFNSDFQPQDQLDARAERALSSFDQRHRLVGMSIIELPRRGLLAGWTIAPIFTATSGRPFNVVTGYDNLGDNHPTTHRPWGAGRNIGHGPDFFTWDMRLARYIPFGKEGRHRLEFTAECFNLLNRTNFKNVNNTVGDMTLDQLPHPLVGVRGNPILPLSFTSAFDPRQFQFGLRVNY